MQFWVLNHPLHNSKRHDSSYVANFLCQQSNKSVDHHDTFFITFFDFYINLQTFQKLPWKFNPDLQQFYVHCGINTLYFTSLIKRKNIWRIKIFDSGKFYNIGFYLHYYFEHWYRGSSRLRLDVSNIERI